MVDFNKVLGDALAGPSQPMNAADADLNDVVTQVSDAIRHQVADADLRLTVLRKGADGILYALSFITGAGGKQGPIVEGILVSSIGYPIAIGQLLDLQNLTVLAPVGRIELNDKNAVEAHFAELLSNANSPVFRRIAYLKNVRRE